MSTATAGITADFAVTYRDFILDDLAREAEITKKVVAAVLENKKDFKLDPKGRSAGELAWHILSVDVQFLNEIAEGEFHMEERYKAPGTIAEMVAWYSKEFPAAIERIRKMTAEQLTHQLDFYGAFHFPAFMYLSFAQKHCIHHRGQLAAYLRPLGSKVPDIYGCGADEPWN